MTLPREIQTVYVRRARESLRKHRPDPAGMCDWCAAVWLRRVRHPCLAACVALAVQAAYGPEAADAQVTADSARWS